MRLGAVVAKTRSHGGLVGPGLDATGPNRPSRRGRRASRRGTAIAERIGGIAPRPVLLIYAEPGAGGESTRQPAYFAAAGEPKAIWRVPGASHTGGIDAQPVEYERRVTAFFETALLGTHHPLERSRP